MALRNEICEIPDVAARRRPPRTEFACLVGHEALFQGELQELTYGFWYEGTDERGLPLRCCEEGDTIDTIQFYPILDNYWRGAQSTHPLKGELYAS